VRFHTCTRSGLIAAILVGALLLSGCVAASERPLTLPQKNIDRWVNPLDQFVPHEQVAAGYAELLLNSKCMRASGYDWNPPWRDVYADWGPSWNDAQRRLFTVALATRYGYHEAPSGYQAAGDQWAAFMATDADHNAPGEQRALSGCVKESRSQLADPGPDINLAMSYIGTVLDEVTARSEVIRAAERWHECMRPYGVEDLPESPARMPTHAIMKKFGLSSAPGGSAQSGTGPSAEEITLATADAECRVSSGYDDAAYAAEWDASVTFYRDNADALERARAAIRKNEQLVKLVISQNAPSK
jgi:hypothetical protein